MAAEFLARGVAVRCADLSPAMREETGRRLTGRPGFLGVEAIDLESDASPGVAVHDLVLCFRFLHHLPDAATRRRVLAHLTRRSRGALLVSFHHPVSVHQVARGVRRLVTGRRGDRHAVTLRALRHDAAAVGWVVVAAAALAPGLRDLWVALLEPAARAER
jgi:SAM-dependent methyltransferase